MVEYLGYHYTLRRQDIRMLFKRFLWILPAQRTGGSLCDHSTTFTAGRSFLWYNENRTGSYDPARVFGCFLQEKWLLWECRTSRWVQSRGLPNLLTPGSSTATDRAHRCTSDKRAGRPRPFWMRGRCTRTAAWRTFTTNWPCCPSCARPIRTTTVPSCRPMGCRCGGQPGRPVWHSWWRCIRSW